MRPDVKFTFRGDSGFCRRRMLAWWERHGVDYRVGLAKNARWLTLAEPWRQEAERRWAATSEKQRVFAVFDYAAATWRPPRRVLVKAEHSPKGANPGFLVTHRPGDPHRLYE